MRELHAVIEELAERLHRAVAIDDPAIRLLAHTAHDERVDEHRVQSIMTLRAGPEISEYVYGLGIRTSLTPVRVPARPDLRMLGRLCVPIRCQDVHLGYLWLIDDDESLTAEEIAASVHAADKAGEILFRSRLVDDLRRARERELLLDLIADDPQVSGHVRRSDLEAAGLTGRLACRVVVVHVPFTEDHLDTGGDELSLESVLRRGVRRLQHVRSLAATRRGGRGYLLVAFRPFEDPLADLLAVGRGIHDELAERLAGEPGVVVGVGPQVPDVTGAPLSCRRARGVVQVCRAVREFAPVAAWDDLGIYRILHQLPLDDLADVAIPPGLRTLIAAQADQWLVDTLETYLDAAGNVQESARRMHIHRATLYYRLSRIEELTGMSLANGQDRLALHLGVKLARLTGEVSPVGAPTAEPTAGAGAANGPAELPRRHR